MKAFLLFLSSLLSCSNIFSQDCSQLKNGVYIIEYDSSFKNYPKATFEVKDDTCYVTNTGKREKFQIARGSKCSFSLKSDKAIDTTNFTQLQKVLNKQKPYYDIYKVEGNTYWFIRRIDLHIINSSGKFIKLDK